MAVASVVKKHPAKFWEQIENRKKLLDEIAYKLCIKEPKEWGKVPTRRVISIGGGYVLSRFYNGSLVEFLKSVYKG